MSAYRDPFSRRAGVIARQAILRADTLGMEHYGPAPAPLDETRDMIEEAVEELQDGVYYLIRQIAKLEDLREKIGADPRRCISPAGRRSDRRVAEKGKRLAGDPKFKSGPGEAPQRGGIAPRTGKASGQLPGAKSKPGSTQSAEAVVESRTPGRRGARTAKPPSTPVYRRAPKATMDAMSVACRSAL